jgi:hypothetical protein
MRLRDLLGSDLDLERLLIGMSQEELSRVAAPYAEEAGGQDKAMHQIASALMAKRLGVVPSLGIGAARELFSGAKEGLAGRPMISTTGFDPNDIRANLTGIQRGMSLGEILLRGR